MGTDRCRLILALLLPASALLSAHADPERWEPLLAEYCFDCHDSASAKGGIDLETALEADLSQGVEAWEKTLRQLQVRMMPPLGKDRPDDAEYDDLVQSLEAALDANGLAHPHPGRTETLRRLTRKEYQNAVRDLLAVEVDARTLLPADSSSHGFDNVTVGDLPPALLDRYIGAAEKIARRALGRTGRVPDGRTVRVRPDRTQEGHVEGLPLGTRGGVLIRHHFPRDGHYEIRINLMRDRNEMVEGLSRPHTLEVLLDGEVASSFEVRPPKNRRDHTKVDAHLSGRIEVAAGMRDLGVTFVAPAPALVETLRQPYQSAFNTHRHPRRNPAVYQVSITGPFEAGEAGRTASRQRILGKAEHNEAGAREILRRLMRLAYRGHADDNDLARAMEFYRTAAGPGGEGFEAGLEAALSALLVSPKFLFRVERDPDGLAPGTPYRLSDLELASRLSFFLWSSLPDDVLLDVAEAGELHKPEVLIREARRLLRDPRSVSLVDSFANQWLYLRNLDTITPDGRLFPDFDDNLRQAMRRETELLFESVMREERSVLDLLRSDHTFLNERLAKHYGVPHVVGERFRKVALGGDHPRGGILRHGSILTVTSYANRTSPVLRGHWVLENILGSPPPPPPPDVPALEDNKVDASLPVRERLAVHREIRSCARCHDPMDPVGFAFEHFDAIGQWRTREGEAVVDSKGALPDGTTFEGVAGLEEALLARPELFVRTFTEKLLTYALGRGIESTDAPLVREIVRRGALDEYRFSAIIDGIVASDLFRMRMTESAPDTP